MSADTDDDALVRVRDLQKYYPQADGILDRLVGESASVKAVDGVDLTIGRGETVAVVGESGCGKSTLGRTVLNLEDVTGGEIEFDDDEIAGLSDREMRPYRRRMQMIFQDPLASLNPRQSVGSILTAPMERPRPARTRRAGARTRGPLSPPVLWGPAAAGCDRPGADR